VLKRKGVIILGLKFVFCPDPACRNRASSHLLPKKSVSCVSTVSVRFAMLNAGGIYAKTAQERVADAWFGSASISGEESNEKSKKSALLVRISD
jgi:hypothetical protein